MPFPTQKTWTVLYDPGISKFFSPTITSFENLNTPSFLSPWHSTRLLEQSPTISCSYQAPCLCSCCSPSLLILPCSMKCSHPWGANSKVIEWNRLGPPFQDRIYLFLFGRTQGTLPYFYPKQSIRDNNRLLHTSLPISLNVTPSRAEVMTYLCFYVLCHIQKQLDKPCLMNDRSEKPLPNIMLPVSTYPNQMSQ